jgi:hypothetical protein
LFVRVQATGINCGRAAGNSVLRISRAEILEGLYDDL